MTRKKVLFSPLGGTDPISNFRDGSMLHICRVYRPDVVVLYMSKEIVEYHNSNDRYCYCIRKLSELIDHEFEIRIIQRPELEDVHKYDYFYREFSGIINSIHQELDCDIYLNISSGTPAMKNALNILSELMNIKLYPVQVATPEKSINPHEEDNDDYDVETYWELNKDNEEFCDRSEIIDNVNQTALLVASNMKELIDAYDYYPALRLAESIRDFLDPEAIRLLEIADARSRLDKSEFTKKGGEKYGFIPVKESNIRDIIEYIFLLQIKVSKGEYADFLRAITPVFYEICKYVVEQKCGINLGDSTFKMKDTGALRWKNKPEDINPQIYEFFIETYDSYRGGYVSSEHLTKLIFKYDGDVSRKKAFDEFRVIEESVRNIAAHNLIAITDQWILSKCDIDSKGIIKKLKKLVSLSAIRIPSDGWNSYDIMNERIKESMKLR